MQIEIKVLPAGNGDSILIKLSDGIVVNNLLIDGGVGKEGIRALKEEINLLNEKKESIDLLVVTHIDDDHINGIINIFSDYEINKKIFKDVWFNSGSVLKIFFDGISDESREVAFSEIQSKKASVTQGNTFEKQLEETGIWSKELIYFPKCKKLNHCTLQVLSPNEQKLSKLNKHWITEENKNKKASSNKDDYTKTIEELKENIFIEDTALPNGSSIAFLIKNELGNILMLGDSHPSIIEASLRELGYSEKNKLKVEVTKVSHHGSKKNTSQSLLGIICCENFILSTNGNYHGHPDKECLARIIKSCDSKEEINLYFNYSFDNIFKDFEIEEYNIVCHDLSNRKNEKYIMKLGVK